MVDRVQILIALTRPKVPHLNRKPLGLLPCCALNEARLELAESGAN